MIEQFKKCLYIFLFTFGLSVQCKASDEVSYVQGVFVLKLKTNNALEISALQTWAKEKGASSCKQKFGYIAKPSNAFLKEHPKATDLTSIFEVEVPAPLAVEPLVTEIRRWTQVIYAERLFNHKVLFNPNDPFANQTTGSQKDMLSTIKAYQAWDVTKGDSATQKIAIVDTGVLWNHEDMADNVANNMLDPINGIDDDRNGLVDDYRGWDFSDNDNNPITQTDGHGNVVASLSSARGNNGIGVAGVAFAARFLPVKVFGNRFTGYDGLAYAAEKNCSVINLSWGRPNGGASQFEQDVLNYATFNKNAVVVAAAGNTAGTYDFFPSSYENVISVIHTYIDDRVEPNSSSSYSIDIAAPGATVFAIRSNGQYGNAGGGSSFAAPMVAGGAALVRSLYPNFSALQVAEILRVNSDDISAVGVNNTRMGMMGTGRLNLLKAVTMQKNVSIRAQNPVFTSSLHGNQILAGDTVTLSMEFMNYLNSVNNFRVSCSAVSNGIVVLQNTFVGPSLPSGAYLSNETTPFQFVVGSGVAGNSRVVIKLDFIGDNYTDSQYLTCNLNDSYLTHTNSRIQLTVGANGRLAYNDSYNTQGLGFRLDNKNVLADAGLIIATNTSKIVNNIIDTTGKDMDFMPLQGIRYKSNFVNGEQSTALYNDDNARDLAKIGIRVKQIATSFNASPSDRLVFIRYDITNTSTARLDSLCVGLYTDFDCGNYNKNRADWDTVNKIGYTYSTLSNNAVAGVHLLSNEVPCYYAIDALAGYLADRNLDITNGFSLAEKFAAVSQGIARTKAGYNYPSGNNVASVTGYKLYRLAPNETRTIAFALVVGDNLAELRNSVSAGISLYRTNQSGPIPIAPSYSTCNGGLIDIVPINGNNFRFYDRPSLAVPISTGRFLRVNNARGNRRIYITNADSLFESTASSITISTFGPNAQYTIPARVVLDQGRAVVNPILANTSSGLHFRWTSSNNQTDTSTSPQFIFNTLGSQFIQLIVSDSTCTDSLTQHFQVVLPSTSNGVLVDNIEVYPNPTIGLVTIKGLVQDANFTVIDAIGRTVLSGSVNTNNPEISVEKLKTGTYSLLIENHNVSQRITLVKE